jgi:signal transduction histidine kinase
MRMRGLKPSSQRLTLFQRALPWVILAGLAFTTYTYFFQIPYAGFEFEFDRGGGRVSYIYGSGSPPGVLRLGDRLVQIGPVSWNEFEHDRSKSFFVGTRKGQVIPVIVERGGQTLAINWVYPGPDREQILSRLNRIWWLDYIFWLAGTMTLIFIRPKDTRWKLFLAFNYITAIGLAAGSNLSHWHIGASAFALRVAVWLALPIYLHFHWVFPRRIRTLPKWVWGLAYAAGGIFAGLEIFQLVGGDFYNVGFISAVIGSVLLLILHAIYQPAYRRDSLMLIGGIILILIPPTALSILFIRGYAASIVEQNAALLTLPSLPGLYFFVIYRLQFRDLERMAKRPIILYVSMILTGIGIVLFYSFMAMRYPLLNLEFGVGPVSIVLATLTAAISLFPFLVLPALAGASYSPSGQPGKLVIRANRLVSSLLFFIFLGGGMGVLIISADARLNFIGDTTVVGVSAALLCGIITATAYQPFQGWVERKLLSMPLPRTHLMETYAARITTSLERKRLIKLLQDEVLPTLLVRQSALLWFEEKGSTGLLFASGVSGEELPTKESFPGLLAEARVYRPPPSAGAPLLYPWARLILPLKVGDEVTGAWLLGSRDPDDFYALGEIPILQALADQTAIALTNILQAEQLRAIHQANISRQEAERAQLALMLHDEVLNELAGLGMQADRPDFSQRFLEALESLNARIRETISDLRPMTLNYGLGPALEEYGEELAAQVNGSPRIEMGIHSSGVRYPPECESHLYWIVRQACENALQHAQASRLRVYGNLEADQIRLVVEDDGTGSYEGQDMDLPDLLAGQHYGLVGMHERAAILGAELEIHSEVGRGTRVSVVYRPAKFEG